MKKYKLVVNVTTTDDEIIGVKEEIASKIKDAFIDINIDFVDIKEIDDNIQAKFI